MTTMTFWARGDSATANNAALNVQGTSQVPATAITFTSGANGDIVLDYNGGAPDPDTQVIINGVTMNFTVEFSGTLPMANKLANVGGADLRGDQITVITAANGQRYFFLNDGSGTQQIMNAFPNGAEAIGNVTTGGKVLICFAEGTLIATPQGERAIETLHAGDMVLNTRGEACALRWIGQRHLSGLDQLLHPEWRPIVVAAGALGQGLPRRDLRLSAQHRVLVSGWQVQLFFGSDEILVLAVALADAGLARSQVAADGVTFYHLLFDRHEIILSEGQPTESFQPGAVGRGSLDETFASAIAEGMAPRAAKSLFARPDAARSLRRREARALLSELSSQVARVAA